MWKVVHESDRLECAYKMLRSYLATECSKFVRQCDDTKNRKVVLSVGVVETRGEVDGSRGNEAN